MHEGAGEPSVPSFHGSKWPICCGNSSSATAGPGCRGRVGRSSCPRLLRHPRRGGPHGGGRATPGQHGRAPRRRRRLLGAPRRCSLHPAGLPRLPRRPGRRVRPGGRLGDLSGPELARWFRARHSAAAPATWNRELATLRAAVGWWPPWLAWRATQPRGWSAAATGQTARGRSPAASWKPCSSTVTCRCCWPAPGTPRSVP